MSVQKLIKQEMSSDSSYEITLTWDIVKEQNSDEIDLDLQCVILDDLAQIEDAVYYNQQSSKLVEVSLSDDQRGASAEQKNETMKISLKNADYAIKYLVILVCSHNGQPLSSLGSANILVKSNQKEILSAQIGGQGNYLSYIPCVFSKNYDGSWCLEQTNEGDVKGKTFLECEDLIKRSLIKVGFDEGLLMEAKNWNGKKAFNLQKEDTLLIPEAIVKNEIFVGLGWDTRCDIDSSILTYDEKGNLIENIYYGNKRSLNGSILHHGDNLTGDGDGDDEVITIKLNQMDERVSYIWTIITVFTTGKTLSEVEGTFCRLVDSASKKEFCKYNLSQESKKYKSKNGCIMACIKKYKNNQWAIQPKGFLIEGQRTSSGVVPIINNILKNNLTQVTIIKEANQKQTNIPQQSQRSQTQIQSQQPTQTTIQQQNIQQKTQFELTEIKGINIIANGKTANPYAKIKVNQKQIGRTETLSKINNPAWLKNFSLTLKEGDVIKIKFYSYAKFSFDDFLGKIHYVFKRDNLNSGDIKVKLVDKRFQQNSRYPGEVVFKLN